jgi:hypothetical protein
MAQSSNSSRSMTKGLAMGFSPFFKGVPFPLFIVITPNRATPGRETEIFTTIFVPEKRGVH